MDGRAIDWMTALSLVLGAYVVLAGLATLVGMPWRYTADSTILMIVRGGGALLAVAFGVALGWVALHGRR